MMFAKKKKSKKEIIDRISKSRFFNDLKRKRLKQINKANSDKFKLSDKQFANLSTQISSNFKTFFDRKIGVAPNDDKYLEVPRIFSFTDNFDITSVFLEKLHWRLYNSTKSIIIDFSGCSRISLGAITILQVSIGHYNDFEEKFNTKYYAKIRKEIIILPSNEIATNKMLFALNLISEFPGMNKLADSSKFLSLGLKVGSKSRINFRENNKGKICSEIINFVNKSLNGLSIELVDHSKNSLNNLMGEILGNAEDHSLLNNFYVNGVSFMEEVDDSPIIELNLSIVNLGYSIYEGFELSKDKNKLIYSKMEKIFGVHEQLINGQFDSNYSRESLFTLYALQEGISRIKFKEASRGNGTMNFIRAFINLGAFGEKNEKYESRLNVISGSTVIECDNKHKPYERFNSKSGKPNHVLSLNKENDIRMLPDRKYIFANNKSFPGTILQVKIFMNKDYFMEQDQIDQND